MNSIKIVPAVEVTSVQFALTDLLTVVATSNPKRPETKAWRKWALYAGCKTVADVRAAFAKAGFKRGRADSALRWDLAHGFVRVAAVEATKKKAA